ncbi:MAG: hypothetical protein QOI65_176 [Thermoleophilaceae bacterium]|jgi:hypothetical protein|nr:hypothetical protein [Thermoleophilaceae bacterium]
MRRALALLSALALVLAVAAIANAKSINDPEDTQGKIDIKKATFSKTKTGKFKIVVVFFEKVPASGEQGNEYINVWKKKPHAMAGCNCFTKLPYEMQGPQTGKRDVYKAGSEGTGYKKTGSGTIRRDGNRLIFKFPPKAVGKPTDKLFWRVTSGYYGNNDECPTFDDCSDFAPNAEGKVVKETL